MSFMNDSFHELYENLGIIWDVISPSPPNIAFKLQFYLKMFCSHIQLSKFVEMGVEIECSLSTFSFQQNFECGKYSGSLWMEMKNVKNFIHKYKFNMAVYDIQRGVCHNCWSRVIWWTLLDRLFSPKGSWAHHHACSDEFENSGRRWRRHHRQLLFLF